MSRADIFLSQPALRGWVLALAAFALSSHLASATPYASCLTNTGTSIIFRLNEAADNVKLVYNGDTATNDLGALPAGLTTVPATIAGTYKIVVFKAGSAGIYQIGNAGIATNVAYNSPRGVAVVGRASDPNFGRLYVANSAAGTKGDGIYIHHSDLSLGYASAKVPTNSAGTAYPFTGSASSPFHLTVAPNGQVFICDWSDATGNLIYTDPDVNLYDYALQPLTGTAAAPVGTANNHGSVQSVAVQGSTSGGDMVIYTVDEDYQEDPTTATLYQMNSMWRYEVGAGPLPYAGVPKLRLVPSIQYLSQSYNTVSVGPNGYIYYNQRRENASGPPGTGVWSPSLMILDPNMYIDATNWAGLYDPTNLPGVPNPELGGLYTLTSNYWKHATRGGFIWESQSASTDVGSGGADYLLAMAANSISPDGKWLAGITYYNTIFMIPLTNGIPDMTRRLSLVLGGTVAGRDVAWDPANNFYLVSSGLQQLRYYSLGLTATATTTSDGQFSLFVPATVGVTATTPVASEQGPAAGVFTLTRSGDPSLPLPVNFTISGTATRGAATGYVLQTNNVTLTGDTVIIPAGASSLVISVVPTDDAVPELTQTAIFNFAASGNYTVDITAPRATVTIVDNETPELRILSMSKYMYENNPYDYSRLRIERWGNTNAALVLNPTDFTCGGTAVSNVDYYVTNLPATMAAGVVNLTIPLLGPINNSAVDGTRIIGLTMLAGTGYNVISNTATVSITDDDVPLETVLWSDNLETDTSANWTQFYGSTNSDNPDFTVNWYYDYLGAGIPLAPHSPGPTGTGLRLTVNKNSVTNAAGLNLYPTGQSFSGDYALRFDMYLTQGATLTTEYAIFGINHSGTRTNWFRNSGTGHAGSYDGVWAVVEADASGTDDYIVFSSPTVANGAVWGPTYYARAGAGAFNQNFQSPPWTIGGGSGGSPGNLLSSTTPSWAEVELSQIAGVITLKINNTKIFELTNTTPYTSGNIMLGYDDAYDSRGVFEASVIYANARVISLARPVITNIVLNGGNVEITFTANAGDVPAQFTLQEATPAVTGPYGDTASTITSLGGGAFKSVKAAVGNPAFYRIRRIY